MPVVISSDFVVTAPESVDFIHANSPRIGYEDFVADATATADEEADGQPVTLLQHYLTAPGERWAGTSTAEQYVEFDFGEAKGLDYVGIAAHNLGTIGATIALEVSTDGETWTAVGEAIEPANDEALIFLFGKVSRRYLRLKITPGSAAPEIGVVYAGSVLSVQHKIYGGHSPVTLGRRAKRVGQVSDSGHFLGIVVNAEWYEFSASFDHLQPDWYRSYFEPFAREALKKPFFWAWRPSSYPREVGFAWLTSPARPSNEGMREWMEVSLDMRAFVG